MVVGLAFYFRIDVHLSKIFFKSRITLGYSVFLVLLILFSGEIKFLSPLIRTHQFLLSLHLLVAKVHLYL